MKYTAINRRLQELQAQEDSLLAAQARSEYHDNFADHFSYKKGGVTYVKTKDKDVAKQYRRLIGIADCGDDRDDSESDD